MQNRPDRLDVYYGSDLVGAVHDSTPLSFEYAPAWLGGTQRMTLATIPLQSGRQAAPEVQASGCTHLAGWRAGQDEHRPVRRWRAPAA